ncbi:hypothetical protein NXY11_00145 [Parabacteroides faecis]|uniref:hypothetical protein n=1 Tax=Parabacteroides faecis TaxID=1217282 RepID=UPI002164E27C|nr:hypothetical protein [Parabacteroides faecis]MCS2889581.1 hypothetical protein [Parabacteroides faecis]UVQ46708.1 hypothetical protein NXY11_00145 [Parabacteroides faecis]
MDTAFKKIIETQSRYIHISIPFIKNDYAYSFNNSNDSLKKYPLVTENEQWEATIDLEKHTLLEWKSEYGFCRVFAKVKDEGIYTLLDKDKKTLCRLKGYVPNGVIPPKDGYGDYIKFNIDENGFVSDWYENYNFSVFIERGKIVTEEDMTPITNPQQIWETLQNVFVPLALALFQELRDALSPSFTYSSEYAYLSDSLNQDNLYPIDIEKPLIESEATPEMQKNVTHSKSFWLTFGVASPKRREIGSPRLQIAYHLELKSNSYYLPVINKKIPYGTFPTECETGIIIQSLKEKAMEMVSLRKSGIIEY